ncbi:MAG: putative dual-specificity RNA methyltransferase RlmN, partial [Parcubacteria group bacterium GW2011_GWC1_35_21]
IAYAYGLCRAGNLDGHAPLFPPHPSRRRRNGIFRAEIKSMDIINLEKFLKERGEKDYRLKQVKKAVFVDLVNNWDEATTLSRELREEIPFAFLPRPVAP